MADSRLEHPFQPPADEPLEVLAADIVDLRLPFRLQVREIYKTVYPGYGAATGSGAFAPGLQAGGSSTKASTSGAMLGKGVATMIRKVQDEELRARLETRHEFQILIRH